MADNEKTLALTGNEAAAWAMKMARVRAGMFFPIGPADEVMELAQVLIDSGEMPDSRIISMENEKSVVSCQIGLARMGIRSLFATCTEGILWPAAEVRYAAGSRLPMLIAVTGRGIEPPTTVYADQEDFMMQRDMGWLMFYCENAQDIFDTILQAYKISEHRSVLLPAFVGYEGWETSHSKGKVTIPPHDKMDAFLPPYPLRVEGDYALTDWRERCKVRRLPSFGGEHIDMKYFQVKALEDSEAVIESVGKEYQQAFGSRYTGFLEADNCQDADIVVLTMGVLTPLVKFVAAVYRRKGIRVGSVKLRVFRPFPAKQLYEAVKNAKVVIVLERNPRAAVMTELKAAIYNHLVNLKETFSGPKVIGKIAGIGGKWVSPEDVMEMIDEGVEVLKTGQVKKELQWVGVTLTEFDPLVDYVGE